MRKVPVLLLSLCLCLLLAGCAHLIPDEIVWSTPHETQEAGREETDALEAENYAGLRSAIRSLVENNVEHGVIRVYNYVGDVAEDLAKAAYAVSREEPLGAYAVDYMTHDCTLIVSYYEIRIDITFRKTPQDLASVRVVSSVEEAEELLRNALKNYDSTLVLSLASRNEPDYARIAQEYYDENPAEYMALPAISVQTYPQESTMHITEVQFQYPESADDLKSMARAVRESLSAADIYVRYRPTEMEKAELLFTYLSERFAYQSAETPTPVFSALCEGLATPQSMVKVWKLLCDRVGIDCRTVDGFRDGQSYCWSMICLDGQWFHADIFRDALSGVPQLCYDEDMHEFIWDTAFYPSAPAPIPEPPEELPPEETPSAEQEPAQAPDEEQPPAEPEPVPGGASE